MKKLTKNEYIKKANIIHNNRYLYDNVEYISSSKKVKIICKEHGEFEQVANSHLRGIGCPSCSGNIKSNKNDFINKSNYIHKNKYDYSLVEYKGAKNKVKIICKEHGIFEQNPNNHLNSHGCSMCGFIEKNKKNTKSLEHFIKISNTVHKNKYDYSLVEYKGAKNKVKIICKEHGDFDQSPSNHMSGQGCKKCGLFKVAFNNTKTTQDFIKEAIEVHKDKYNYSLVEYKGTDNKVKIICKEHGEFNQSPTKHLQNQGCPICSESKLEKKVRLLLIDNDIKYLQQYGKKGDSFYLNGQSLDFYLPEYKLAIECQGDQHFIPVDFGNKGDDFSNKMFEKIIIRDNNKYNLCKDLNIKIIYFCEKENYKKEYIGKMFYKDYDIINKIKNIKNEFK